VTHKRSSPITVTVVKVRVKYSMGDRQTDKHGATSNTASCIEGGPRDIIEVTMHDATYYIQLLCRAAVDRTPQTNSSTRHLHVQSTSVS